MPYTPSVDEVYGGGGGDLDVEYELSVPEDAEDEYTAYFADLNNPDLDLME